MYSLIRLLIVVCLFSEVDGQIYHRFRKNSAGLACLNGTADGPAPGTPTLVPVPPTIPSGWTTPAKNYAWCDPFSNTLVRRVSDMNSEPDLNKSIGFSPLGTKIQVFETGGVSYVYPIDTNTLVSGTKKIFATANAPAVSYSDGYTEVSISAGGLWVDENTVIAVGQRALWKVDVSGSSPFPASLLAELSPTLMVYKAAYPSSTYEPIFSRCFSSNSRLQWICRITLSAASSTGACGAGCPNDLGYIAFTLPNLNVPVDRTAAQSNYTVRRKFFNGIDSANLGVYQTTGTGDPVHNSSEARYKLFCGTVCDYAVFTVDSSYSRVLNLDTGAWSTMETGNHGYEGSNFSIYGSIGGAFPIKKLTYGGSPSGISILDKPCFYLCISGYIHGGDNEVPVIYEGPSAAELLNFNYPYGPPEGVVASPNNYYAYNNRVSKIVGGTVSPIAYAYVGVVSTYPSPPTDLRQPMVSPDGTMVMFNSNFGAVDGSRGAVLIAKIP